MKHEIYEIYMKSHIPGVADYMEELEVESYEEAITYVAEKFDLTLEEAKEYVYSVSCYHCGESICQCDSQYEEAKDRMMAYEA